MDGKSDPPLDGDAPADDAFPDGLTPGSTVLVAVAGDPSAVAVDLHILCRYGGAGDTAFVVTTTESAGQTIETYERLRSQRDRPSLRVVDTTSEQQSVSAPYGEIPIVFTPAPGDLERMVLALADLSDDRPRSTGARHLVVRSLSPVLEAASPVRVLTVLERVTGLRSEAGFCLLGLDFTAHDTETMVAVTELVDGILWVTRSSPDRLAYEYRPASGRHIRP